MQAGAQGGVDAVRANQRSPGDLPHRPVRPLEACGYAIRMLPMADQPLPGPQGGGAKPLRRSIPQQRLQPPTVDRKLRHVVPGVRPARLGPDRLAQVVGIRELPGAYAGGIQPGQQAEGGQLADAMRQGVDADAQGADLLRRLEHHAGEAALVQHQRQRQAANAAASDQDGPGRRLGHVSRRRANSGRRASHWPAGSSPRARRSGGRPPPAHAGRRAGRTGHTAGVRARPRTARGWVRHCG